MAFLIMILLLPFTGFSLLTVMLSLGITLFLSFIVEVF